MAARKIHTLTISLVGIPDRATLEAAIKELHAYRPSFTVSRIAVIEHRRTGCIVVHTADDVTHFLDDVSDLFHANHATPVVWPAPQRDTLGLDGVPFVYPPARIGPTNAIEVNAHA